MRRSVVAIAALLACVIVPAPRAIGRLGAAVGQQQAAAPASSANPLPALTQAEMAEDFDALVRIIRDVMPTIAANKAVYGFDVLENLAQYRRRLPSVRTTEEFILLLDQAINSCKGSHLDASPLTLADLKPDSFMQKFVDGAVTEAALAKHERYQAFLKEAHQRSALEVPLFYLAGEYYVRHDFSYDGNTYARGLRVVSCNGRRANDIVASTLDTASMLPWDFTRRQFYTASFYAAPGVACDGRLTFVFEAPSGARTTATFASDGKTTFVAPARARTRLVEYFPDLRVLYLRVPSMNPADTEFYTTGIAKEGTGREVRAAVIDIRGNGGGSDNVWTAILGALLDRKVTWHSVSGIRNSDVSRAYLMRHGAGPYYAERGRPRRIPFLGNDEFLVVEADTTITPAETSLKVPTIYVLTNSVFSAAGSLTTVARLAAPIVSVGTRNPYILGRGIDPYHFSLPRSGFTFRIEPMVDLTGASKAEDVFHTEVEVEIAPTLAEMLAFHNETQENLEALLTSHDPFFRKVLDLLASKAAGR